MDNKYNRPMSVYCWTFTRSYVFRHPIRILKWRLNARKMARQRAVYGWCDNDLTDWYNWAAYVLAGLLTEISDGKLIAPKRAKQIKGIADDIRHAVFDDSELDKRRLKIAEAFENLGKIFFDFFN